ncbi:MAG: TerD family protein [Akkermansiaceae bacterium]|nr:TerD family protein [Armatimonadota bacterium]
MGLWKRFRDWRQGQNAADRATETPEQALDRAIREMVSALESAHAHFAELTTYERQIRAARDKSMAEARTCEAEARRHVLTGRDDLARVALGRKAEHDSVAAEYQRQWETQNAVMLALKAQIETLAGQQRDAVRNRDLLLARERAANAQMRMRETLESAQKLAPVQAIRDTEARAVAEAELAGWIPSRSQREEFASPDPETQFAALREQTAPPAPPPLPLWFPDTPKQETLVEPIPETITQARDVWFADEPRVETGPELIHPPWFEPEPQHPPSNTEPSANAVFANPAPDLWFPEPSHGLPNENALPPGANRMLQPAATYHVSLGWEAPPSKTVPLGVCAILCGVDGLARGLSDVVAEPQRSAGDGSIAQNAVPVPHQADATVFTVQVESVPPDVQKVVFAVFVDDEAATYFLREVITSVYVRVWHGETGNELATFLHAPTEPERASLLAEVYRHRGGAWKVRAFGQGFGDGLEALLQSYGIGET